MGGNALKKVIASRINLEELTMVKRDLEEKLNQYLELQFTIDVPGKIDFGDVDMLYMIKDPITGEIAETSNFNISQLINDVFNPIEIVLNGPVCSFAYKLDNETESDKYFQVDLIRVKDMPMSGFYYSYGDLGGIIGRLTQHKCLTFGENGLWINPNQETIDNFISIKEINLQIDKEIITKSNIPKIILTNKPDEICQYLGLDWFKYLDGFSSKQEIFEWITNSPWFKKDYFRALDHGHRRRVNSRPMYEDFLTFIFHDEPELLILKGNSEEYIHLNLQIEALEHFDKVDIFKEEIIEIEKKLLRKEKFSGKKFVEFGIKAKQINEYLNNFKQYVEIEYEINFEHWLDSNESIEIDKVIRIFMERKIE